MRLGVDEAAIAVWIQQQISELSRGLGRYSVSIATGVLGAIESSVLVIFTLFLLLRDGDRIVESIPDLLPFDRQRSQALLRRIKAALWSVVTMFASLLPVVGAFAIWGPASAYLAFSGNWPQAIVLAVWGTFVVSGIDNILRPRLVAGRVGLSEVTMLFAMLGGLSVFGGLGIVLGPVVFATAAAIVDTLRAPQADESVELDATARSRD